MMDISLEINKSTSGRSGSVATRNSTGVETPHSDNTLVTCLNRYVFTQMFAAVILHLLPIILSFASGSCL